MSQTVEEGDLDFRHFRCCGDEDLYPFGCPQCGRLMVFCYECDTLYDNLGDLSSKGEPINHSDIDEPIFVCPRCLHPFESFFIRDGKHKVSLGVWKATGYGHLLRSADRLD